MQTRAIVMSIAAVVLLLLFGLPLLKFFFQFFPFLIIIGGIAWAVYHLTKTKV